MGLSGVAKNVPGLVARAVQETRFNTNNIVIIGFNRELVMATNQALGGTAFDALWLLCQTNPEYRPSPIDSENDRQLGYTYIDGNDA